MKKTLILHPMLLAALPIIFLYGQNTDDIAFGEVIWPLVLAVAGAAMVYKLLSSLLRNQHRAALLTSVFALWFLSFGHVETVLAPALEHTLSHPYRILTIGYFALLIGMVIIVLRTRRTMAGATAFLNKVAVGLIIWNLALIGYQYLQQSKTAPGMQVAAHIGDVSSRDLPDIYYIILDGYGRADTLASLYGIDNRAFLNDLEKKGFVVAQKSAANYCQTNLSLSSSLNLNYLDNVVARMGADFPTRRPLARLIFHNEIFRLVKRLGYHTMAFSSGCPSTELRTADIYINKVRGPSQFARLLFFMTPVPICMRALNVQYQGDSALHARRISYTLDHLADAADAEQPVFVFAHILWPHPPFVVDRNGRLKPPELSPASTWKDGSHFAGSKQEYIAGYKDQLLYVNQRVRKMVTEILAHSKRPPVIILQSDHGPGSRLDWEHPDQTDMPERMNILLAMYLPGNGPAPSDELSPVNVFRYVLDRYCGTDMKLLENKHYFSTWSHPYRFLSVDKQLIGSNVAVNQDRLGPGIENSTAARKVATVFQNTPAK
jgi:hypothetical protein